MSAVRKPFALPAARILNVSEDEYFADPCDVPSLSQSVAHTLVGESPLHAWLQHPKLGGAPNRATKATDEGHALHKLLLGKGADIVIVDAADFKTKAAQQFRDAALEAGKIPMIAHKYAELAKAAVQLRENCAVLGYEFNGESEVAVEWAEPGQQGPVMCRGRMDHVFLQNGIIYDVKKTRNANPRYLAKNFVDLGYDIQVTAYTRAIAALNPDLRGRIDFVFLFMETEAPYSVVPARPDGALIEVGELRWTRAVQLWERCLARNHWPSYCNSAITLNAPPWVIEAELGSDAR